MEGGKASRRKGLKICCGILVLIILVLAVVLVSLFFTVFKPKDPILTPHPTKLENVHFQIGPKPSLNATLDLIITVKNPNRGKFEYRDSTATLFYHGVAVAEIPIEHSTVPGRGEIDVSNFVDKVAGDKIVGNPSFWGDMGAGMLNFNSSAALPGKAKVLGMFKIHATVFIACDISVFTNQSYKVLSTCNAKIKL